MIYENAVLLITITVLEIQFPCRPLITFVAEFLKNSRAFDTGSLPLIATTYQFQIEFIELSWPEPNSTGFESLQILITEMSNISDDALHQFSFLFGCIEINNFITIHRNFFTRILIDKCLFVAVMIPL